VKTTGASKALEQQGECMSAPAVATPDSLLQPIEWQGQLYYTAQYFHTWYLHHGQGQDWKLRHTRLDNFVRVIERMPAFHTHVENGDIVVLTPKNCSQHLRALLQRSRQKLVLLNAKAQAALTHHLDDPSSISMSYQINKRAAQTQTRAQNLTSRDILRLVAEGRLRVEGLSVRALHVAEQPVPQAAMTRKEIIHALANGLLQVE
jgi:hypothetical protein